MREQAWPVKNIVFNFIYKIAPTVNLFKTWKRCYSQTFMSIINDITKLTGKIAYHSERRNFLGECLKFHIVPHQVQRRMTVAKVKINRTTIECFLQSDIAHTERNLEKWKSTRSLLLRQVQSELSLVRLCSLFKMLWRISAEQKRKRNLKFTSSLNYLLECNFGKTAVGKTVFNISDVPLNKEEEAILSLGLGQYIPPEKTDKVQVFTDMEQTAFMLSKEYPMNNDKRAAVEASLRKCAHELANASLSIKPATRHSRRMISDLRNKGLALMRPDKGNGTVVMTSSQYQERMGDILEDATKFKKIKSEIDWNDDNGRNKVTSTIKTLVQEKQLPPQALELIPSGCVIPRLYGLAKVHKQNVPLRPVLSMTGSAYHSASRFVDEHLLKPIVCEFDQFTVKDSLEFQEKITSMNLEDGEVCMSFDIKSLFTSIPVNQTIDIICDTWYRGSRPPPKLHENSLSEENCRRLLSTLATDVEFVFNKQRYCQIDGLAMGSPLSGSFSQIFVGALEQSMFSARPPPKAYVRYADDTFLIAPSEKDGKDLLELFNRQHTSIQFTKDAGDHFLDIALHVDSNGCFSTSIYRKDSFTGLYNNFQSFCPKRYKKNLVITLFHRARTLCSPQHQEEEFKFLYRCLRNNGYPTWFIDKFSQPRNERVPTAEKKKIYFRLPYYGEVSERIATCLRKEIAAAYYHLNPVPVFRTRSLAPTAVKDVIPVFQIPKVVYTFSCPCGARYAGRTERCLAVRCTEHLPKWLNKGGTRPRSKQPPTSAITRHLSTCQFRTAIMEENSKVFEVSRTARTTLELAIMESVTIRQTSPDLCVQKDRLFLLRLC